MAKPFIKPHPLFTLSVGTKKEKSKIKKHTTDPSWDQGFVFLVEDPETDRLLMNITDKHSGVSLSQFSYKISDLIQEPNLEFSKREFPLSNEDSKILLSLQLRVIMKYMKYLPEMKFQVLTNELFEDEDSETDSEESSKENSTSSEFQ